MTTTVATDADILQAIERFVAQHKMPQTTFGRRALGDANLIENLRSGRELRRSTEHRVREFMASYRADALLEQRAA
jgi:hypothetical protein